jgi:glycosyltransferase involved in cell wall biosynthesis
VAARDEEAAVARAVEALRRAFPEAEIVVADDGSRDGTAAAAEAAGARVVRLPRRGKGQALTLAEREAPPGPLLLADADLTGDLSALARTDADLAIAAFSRRVGGGFGLAKRVARELVRALGGVELREPRARPSSRSRPASASRCG